MKSLFLLCFLFVSVTALAQDDFYKKEQPKPTRRQYVITLQDGSQLRGELVRQDSLEAVIKTGNLGQVTVKADQITSIVAMDADGRGRSEGEYPNLFPQYMHLAPTAYQAERGKGYFRNSLLYFSQFDYGITDNWSVGAVFLTFVPSALFSINTKVSVPVGKTVRLGIQGQFVGGRGLFDNDRFGANYVQGIATVGTSQRNVTFGVGTVLGGRRSSNAQVLTFGVVQKVNPSLTFISENHVFIGQNVDTNLSLSGGIRFDRRRHSFDVAVLFPFIANADNNIVLFPFASYQLRIGK